MQFLSLAFFLGTKMRRKWWEKFTGTKGEITFENIFGVFEIKVRETKKIIKKFKLMVKILSK